VRTKEELHVKITVQAYADDVIVVSESEERITQMFQILDQFVEWSRMEINVSKCATTSYTCDEDRRRTYLGDSFQFRGEAIPNLATAESMRYLGASITARRKVKPNQQNSSSKRWKSYLGRLCPHRYSLCRR
jgi:hypothetical protein